MKLLIFFCLTLLLVFSIGCGENSEIIKINSSDFLDMTFMAGKVNRISDPVTYVGESLYEYINGGAELYHKYNFLEVATADYKKDNLELVIDIYKFEDPTGSFGLYSMLRPSDPNNPNIGLEGFSSSGSLEFTKDQYIVRIMSYETSVEVESLMVNIAREIDRDILGNSTYPELFTLFLDDQSTPYSKKIYSQSFLGYNFLTDVYKQDYVISNDTFQIFITDDGFDQKYDEWLNTEKTMPEVAIKIPEINFDEGYELILEDSYYGDIVAGRKGDLLVGIINFKLGQLEFINKWLTSLEELNTD